MEALQLEVRVKKLEEDDLELKKYKDECIKSSNETKTGLAVAVQKIEDLITSVEKLPKSLEESMIKSLKIQEKEHDKIYNQIKEIREDNSKMQDELDGFKQIIDDRTVIEDSNNYNQLKFYIATTIIGGFLGYVISFILK